MSQIDHPLDGISVGKIVQIRDRLLQAQAAGEQVYRFESGDPSFSPAPRVIAALKAAADEGRTHYPPAAGLPELRRAIARKLRERNGVADLTPDHVFVTNGAMHALYAVFQALLHPGDEVILPEPMWTEIAENIRLAGGVPRPARLRREADYHLEPEVVARLIGPRTRALFLNSPHNPTGAVLPPDTIAALLRLAQAHGLTVISDEAYEDIVYPPHRAVTVAALAPDYGDRTVSVFSFSKSHAMSGLRTGYIATRHKALLERLPKILRCTINGVNSVAQLAALAALSGGRDELAPMLEEYRRRRDALHRALLGIPGVRPVLPQGAFFLWVELSAARYPHLGCRDADALCQRLAERGLGSVPGDAFGGGCRDALRLSFSCDTDMVLRGARCLRAALLGEGG